MAARTNAPVIGDLNNVGTGSGGHSSVHHFDVTVGYSFLHSITPFNGTFEEKQGAKLHLQPIVTAHLPSIYISYQLNQRWSLTTSLPFSATRREQQGHRTLDGAGIGDVSIGARAWLFRGPTESGGNISMGASLKLPTGNKNADPSVAPGDGGWGVVLESTGYQRTFFRTTLYYSGTYLFSPSNTNGVTVNSNPVSVTDVYLYRAGFSHAVPKVRHLVASLGGRIEGVPVHDAFGRSDGFRRPGYLISVDPGLLYSHGRNTFSMNVPVAMERNYTRSVLDIANNTHGDGAFPDYILAFSYTRHF
ncbi:MAG TPA: hypothetical protein VNW97_04255 [Candidatus Saccharimonadales bacterium]|nr:hypothetical protein [Candidatus Saccharimonadales bacterium]